MVTSKDHREDPNEVLRFGGLRARRIDLDPTMRLAHPNTVFGACVQNTQQAVS